MLSDRNLQPVSSGRRVRLLYLCDWLPPDYGAVGQYSQLFARELAEQGCDVTLVGLSSRESSQKVQSFEAGTLREVRLHAPTYDKISYVRRLLWTAWTNTRLLWHARRALWAADTILFTGSPPFMLHWLGPLNVLLRKRLVYRITDFHPECLMAQFASPGLLLRFLHALTLFWRRRVDEFEVLGHDQAERLREAGIPQERIRLKRDPSPIEFAPGTSPLPRPDGAGDKLLLLYSGNWGVAHDYHTFLAGYALHHRQGSGRFILWLNAVGSAVGEIEKELKRQSLPYVRGAPVPLSQLASLLVTPDAHLITLSDAFVGYVLPSKVHACIESGRPVLNIGSERSDVHRLCAERMRVHYRRVNVGDAKSCRAALDDLAEQMDRSSGGGEGRIVSISGS